MVQSIHSGIYQGTNVNITNILRPRAIEKNGFFVRRTGSVLPSVAWNVLGIL